MRTQRSGGHYYTNEYKVSYYQRNTTYSISYSNLTSLA